MIGVVAGVETRRTVPVPEGFAPEIRIGTASGKVTISTWDEPLIEVAASRPARQAFELSSGGVLDLTHAFGATAIISIRCPAGSSAIVGTATGRVSVKGDLDRVRVTSVSGGVSVTRARVAELRTVSGRIEVGETGDLARLTTRSGHVLLGPAAVAELSSASGRIVAGPVSGDVRAQSVSGRIELLTGGGATVHARTVSGGIVVGLPRGTRPRLVVQSRSGATFDGEQGDDCVCRLQSVSGRIQVEYR